MPFRITHVAAAVVIALPALTASQTIQRCEGPGGRITYSNAECPEGTQPVKALRPTPAPSPEAQRAAQDNAARDAQAVQQMAEQRRSQQAAAAQVQQQGNSSNATSAVPIAPSCRARSSQCIACVI